MELLTSQNEECVGKVKLDADVLGALKVVTVLYNSRRQLYWKINLNNCMELSHEELANIQASTFIEISGEKQKWSPRCSFTFQGRTICKEMFLILYGISYSYSTAE